MTIPTITLNDGVTIPQLGFGTYLLNGQFGKNAIVDALHRGYRLLDSAFNYENEGAVGAAIRESGIKRDDIIVTSKLPGRRHAYKQALVTIEESLFRIGLDYIDIYLIHWPNPKQGLYVEAWQALVEAKNEAISALLAYATSFLNTWTKLLPKQVSHRQSTKSSSIRTSTKQNNGHTTKLTALSTKRGALWHEEIKSLQTQCSMILPKPTANRSRKSFCAGIYSSVTCPYQKLHLKRIS